MVNETSVFLEKLLDVDKLKLSDFESLYIINQQVKNNLTDELKIV